MIFAFGQKEQGILLIGLDLYVDVGSTLSVSIRYYRIIRMCTFGCVCVRESVFCDMDTIYPFLNRNIIRRNRT